MHRRVRVALFVAGSIVAATLLSVAGSNASVTRGVSASGTSFSPAVLDAQAGDSVVFFVEDGTHTVTADDGSFHYGALTAGSSVEVAFPTEGTYRYHCQFHGAAGGTGMSGIVQVFSPSGFTTTTVPARPSTTTTTRPFPPSTTTSTTPPPPPTPPSTAPPPAGPAGRPGPTTGGSGGVEVIRSWEWGSAGAASRYLVGEVENRAGVAMSSVKVTIDMLDSTGRLVATEWTYADTFVLAPGERAGFRVTLSPPPDYATAVARVSADATSRRPNRNFTVTMTNRYTDTYGSEHIVGLVRNDNTATPEHVWVYGTFFDGAGRPAGQQYDLVDAAIPPGQTASWEFVRSKDRAPYVTAHLYGESVDEPTPATIDLGPAAPAPAAPAAPSPVPTISSRRSGYWMVGSAGSVYAFGAAPDLGDPRGTLGKATAVDLEPTPSGQGYWIVDDAGRVYTFGDAIGWGNVDPSGLASGEKITSLAATPSGDGYWIFTSKGRVLTFGHAAFFGDVSHLKLAGPVLDSVVTPSGLGYYMVASDGGIFAFGDAAFHGSMGGQRLNSPVQSLVPDPDGVGYWLVASDGGVFAFRAPFRGAMGNQRLNKPISGMVPAGEGYLMVGEDGGIFDFSATPDGFQGSLGATPPSKPIVSVAVFPSR